ncbi:hypothetical protein HMN09_00794900 [Mycena chlorophos]|uniref:BTB domain-containing protein n=1 Tax=Mycena chlorophos TaxID=658473 RepID=A0A8H6SWY1_MYCCL|nr:hypothetical protein HMN09_00794900 [Mycena chlorophos]
MASTAETTVRDARAPFCPSNDAHELNPPDIILRSRDRVDFHAHKSVLSFASPTCFREMFSFPQPPAGASGADPTRDGKSVVLMPETGAALEKLLVLCYPRYTTADAIDSLDGLVEAYEASKKYDVAGGPAVLEAVLKDARFLEKEPVRVYAIACVINNRDIVQAAATACLKQPSVHVPGPPPIPELASLTGLQLELWKLYELHRTFTQSVGALFRGLSASGDWRDHTMDREPRYARAWWYHADHGGCPLRHPYPVLAQRPEDADDPYAVHPAPWYVDHVARLWQSRSPTEAADVVVERLTEIPTETLVLLATCPSCIKKVQDDLRAEAAELRDAIELHRRTLIDEFIAAF